jgi:hypothetical protein
MVKTGLCGTGLYLCQHKIKYFGRGDSNSVRWLRFALWFWELKLLSGLSVLPSDAVPLADPTRQHFSCSSEILLFMLASFTKSNVPKALTPKGFIRWRTNSSTAALLPTPSPNHVLVPSSSLVPGEPAGCAAPHTR